MSIHRAPTINDDALQTELLDVLSRAVPSALRIRSVARETSPFVDSTRGEIVSVVTDDTIYRFFVKYLRDADAVHPNKQRPDREVRVFQDLLSRRSLPVPVYYAAIWDVPETSGRLYLEYVDGWSLKYQPLPCWYESARALARLHALTASDGLRHRPFLLRLDREYFIAWLDRAIAAAAHSSVRASTTVEALAQRYPRVTELLDAHVQTLVHNDLAPKNVLVAEASASHRIRFVDWELAGVGCGALDLAVLKDGLPPDAERQMVDAYCDGMVGAMPFPDRSTFERILSACDVHKWVYRIARSPNWILAAGTLERWANEAAHAAAKV